MIVDGELEKMCTNGQTSSYMKKLENELSQKTWYIYINTEISFSNSM